MFTLEKKKEIVAELEQKLKSSKAAILADYRGIKVEEATDLRRACRDAGVEHTGNVKNTLTQIAAENSGFPELNELLTGPTAIAFGLEDPVAPAKVLMDFAKKNKNFEIKGGLIEGKVVGFAGVKTSLICRAERCCSPRYWLGLMLRLTIYAVFCKAQ
ncbi:MAG: 50S ribosomal protein L10 [Thermoanaerobacterales bacterium]|nr:50S ribosomal protein L10 [Thermoanaerobacterales bacterium]